MNVRAWASTLAGLRALGVILFCCMTGVSPYTPNERCHTFHLFCKRLLTAFHSPIYIMRQRHQPRPNARERLGVGWSTQKANVPTRPGAKGDPRILSARSARARGRRCPTHMHTHENAGLPRLRRGRNISSRSGKRELQAGRVPASGARAYAHLLPEAPPPHRPPLLPRAGFARSKPRACARVRRPGPSRGGPVDSNESVARARINPFSARNLKARSGSVPAQAGGAPSPQPAPRMHGKGGVPVGVFTAG